MNKYKNALLVLIILLTAAPVLKAYAPMGKDFGFGIMLGEPTGLTAKLWTQKDMAFAFSIGSSYLGKLRIGADYLWHFNAFNSTVVNMYAGPGLAIGIGESGGWWYNDKNKKWYKKNDELGFGMRGVFGINVVPKKSPLEFFGEIGVMVGFLPDIYSNAEGAIGMRFYF